jgi:hypothetical protein
VPQNAEQCRNMPPILSRSWHARLKAKALGVAGRGDPVAVAADGYLSHTRERPLGPSTIRIVKEIVAKFTTRPLNEIAVEDWRDWIRRPHGPARPPLGESSRV